jgi:hypothetical protein
MAAAVGLSEKSVRRIWRKHGLKPHLAGHLSRSLAKRKRRRFSAAQRKGQAESMKAYWAAKKAAAQPKAAKKTNKAAANKAAVKAQVPIKKTAKTKKAAAKKTAPAPAPAAKEA